MGEGLSIREIVADIRHESEGKGLNKERMGREERWMRGVTQTKDASRAR